MIDDPITSDDDDLRDLRVGAIVTVKGRLENVRHGRRGPKYAPMQQLTRSDTIGAPGIVITFADWSMAHINVVDDDTARSIRIPLREYVTVKARVIDEDMTLEAIAIWTQGGVPIPLCLSDNLT